MYIYVVQRKDNGVTVKVVDKRKAKVVRTCSIPQNTRYRVVWYSGVGFSPDYMYVTIADWKNNKLILYRMPADGKGGFRKIGTVSIPYISKASTNILIFSNDKYAYCNYHDVQKDVYRCYKVIFETNVAKEIGTENFFKYYGKDKYDEKFITCRESGEN